MLAASAASAICGAGAMVAEPVDAGGQGPSIECGYGAADHTLAFKSTLLRTVVTVERDGRELVVRADGERVACGSDPVTVDNVDTIVAFAKSEVALDLRGGRLAPGFTDEGDGSSEIEVGARFSRAGGLRVRGSGRQDAIAMGESGGLHSINMNAREAQRDVDVTVHGGYDVLSAIGRGGNDLISARGGPEFDGALQAKTTVSAGSGRDRVRGGSRRDLIGGGAGDDRISPGRGTDRIKSLGGVDRLRLRDRERDYARCGPGEDRVTADRKDRLAGCDTR
jgi:RTX calcium-binding nonapeptide repeat (4 copies)